MTVSSDQVRLALNFPRVFVVGCSSFFEYVVHSASERALMDVVLTFNCPVLGLSDHVIKIGAIAPFESRHGHVDITPLTAGSQPIRCLLEASCERDSLRFSGVCRDFEVYAQPDSQSNVSVIVQDIQSHRSGGDKGEFGSVKGDVNINITDLLPNVKTVNDLLQLRLPDSFLPIRLEAMHSQDACETLSIPEVFLRYIEPADILHISPAVDVPAGDAPRGWRLCGSAAAVVLGRSSQDADLITRFLPSSTENNARSALLSRRHATMRMNEAKGGILVESLAAHAAVRVGTQTLQPGVLTPVPGGEVVGIGQALSDLRLRFTVRKPLLPRRFRVANLSEWIGHRITQDMNEEGNWGHVVVEYLNSAPALWHTHWFHRSIPVGHGHGTVLDLGPSAQDGTSAYLHHLRGGFWLECTQEGEGHITVEGLPLSRGDIVPLRDGMKVRMAGQDLLVKRIR